MAVEIAGIKMANPVTVASGTFASGREMAKLWQECARAQPNLVSISRFPALNCLGALTTKAITLKPWAGNPAPRLAETASGLLNSIGLENPGVEVFCERDLPWLARQNLPLIVNVGGHSLEEYAQVIEHLERASADIMDGQEGPDVAVPAAYELNISCPNVDAGGMAFGVDALLAAELTRRCRRLTRRPLIVKLSPNVTDITTIAQAVQEAGADALSLVNTLTGMAIDAIRRRPLLGRGFGGLSGSAIKPVALYLVHQCYRAVDIPIIGMGGIATGIDAVEFLLAGACAVAVGSASFSDPLASVRVIQGLEDYCVQHGIAAVRELTGSLQSH
jgi:dihydroorotate dehydrogenase (NAD+) catalytic subunit